MNERIEKLAFEAGLKWKAQPPHYTNTNNPIDFPVSANRDLEKFAELIVRECAQAFEAEVDTWKQMDPYQGSIKRQGAKAIKQHFGVEE